MGDYLSTPLTKRRNFADDENEIEPGEASKKQEPEDSDANQVPRKGKSFAGNIKMIAGVFQLLFKSNFSAVIPAGNFTKCREHLVEKTTEKKKTKK